MARQQRERKRPKRAKANTSALILVGAGLLILSVVAWVMLSQPSQAAEEASTAAAEALPNSVVPVAVNYPAPALSLSDLQGRAVSLADYAGKVLLVNNWATWCPPCKAEMPVLQSYYEDHRRQGFVLVGIEAGEPPAEVAAFVQQYGLTFPIWVDPAQQALVAFRNGSLPSSYVIDGGGQVRLAWTGAISRQMLEKYVTPLLED